MHIQRSTTGDAKPYVAVGEPWALSEGEVAGPDLQVWPFGTGTGDYWSMSLEEAQALISALHAGLEQARELFPPGA